MKYSERQISQCILLFPDFVKIMLNKMSALNNLKKKGTPLTLGENKLLVEMVRSYSCLYGKTWEEQ